ncbi:hypothetical protein [Actinoalloteichus fjordicus]|uniref:Uncharacterized protein n=1 Tax=Actinoalloteichus fjordicus TaxID=1612552 RepID=A0AAC9LEF6_9PSEU|nr:hypothetical protein [Actinoalloteichus fjordicus]APU15227.1 hypothetical protein UA74_15875 [Actinoalloteichus fjordicus]
MDYLTVFRRAQPELEQWRQRQVRYPPEEPERGSDLAEDDKVFRFQRISEMARLSLISAGEHLRLVWDGLDRGNLYSSAQHTALRGALVGAAQGVWITAPDDAVTRQRRGHAVISESYEQLRKYQSRTLDVASGLGLTPAGEQQVRAQREWIATRERALAAVQPAPMKLNVADVVRDVGPVVFPEDPFRQAGLRLAWNTLSGDAHVLMWSLAQRAEFQAFGLPDRATGLSIGITGGHLGELAGWYDLAMITLRRGWRLFDRRCEGT